MSERSPRETEFLRQAREKLAGEFGSRAIKHADDHHIAHYRREWEARPEGKHIRDTLVAKGIWRATHVLLHTMCPPVPTPNYQTLQYVAPRLRTDGDIFQKVDSYCELVEERLGHPRMKPIERDVCELSVEATRMQIPFLREGLQNDKRRIII